MKAVNFKKMIAANRRGAQLVSFSEKIAQQFRFKSALMILSVIRSLVEAKSYCGGAKSILKIDDRDPVVMNHQVPTVVVAMVQTDWLTIKIAGDRSETLGQLRNGTRAHPHPSALG
jgi:hypothetical protein